MKERFKDKRFRALIKLILWTIFIIGVLIFIKVENKKLDDYEAEYNQKHNFIVDFDYVKNTLLNNNFDYLYIIIDKDIFSYKGTRTNNLYSGTYTENNNKTAYKDEKLINKKYKYLDMNEILEVFNNDFTKGKNIFIYKNDDLYVKIKVSIKNVINIEINDKKIYYQLEISNIDNFDVKGSE